ncbi:MAG: response regulator [Candidatus Krumholzibacteria bacterium]|nr:response regulator [Candidatus Krumholzibacteria bacterium]
MKRRMLVVDDEPQIREVLRRKLEKCGYEVVEAGDGREAIELLDAQLFDVVIADILMPEKDGLEVIMHAQRDHPTTRCVAISAPSNRVFLQSAELLGATRVIEKPFDLDAFAKVIEEVLRY